MILRDMFGIQLAALVAMSHPTSPIPHPLMRSDSALCCWIPLFALRIEEARQPELANRPAALLTADTTRRLWQVSPLARRAGVRPGMTVSRAIGLCATLRLCEPDPVFYEEEFARLVAALGRVSPVVEPVELGRAYVGTDGLEGLFGGPEKIVEVVRVRSAECEVQSGDSTVDSALRAPHSALRLGWGRGKFVSWTAASRARPGECVFVKSGEEGKYLAAQPLAALPIDPDTHRRLRQLGLRTLGQLAALPEDAVAAQFGDAGRRLWRLAAGHTVEPVTGRPAPEPVAAQLTFYSPVADRAQLARALDRLLDRALASPRRVGWRVQTARLAAALEHGGSWTTAVTLRDPTARREGIAA